MENNEPETEVRWCANCGEWQWYDPEFYVLCEDESLKVIHECNP